MSEIGYNPSKQCKRDREANQHYWLDFVFLITKLFAVNTRIAGLVSNHDTDCMVSFYIKHIQLPEWKIKKASGGYHIKAMLILVNIIIAYYTSKSRNSIINYLSEETFSPFLRSHWTAGGCTLGSLWSGKWRSSRHSHSHPWMKASLHGLNNINSLRHNRITYTSLATLYAILLTDKEE